MHKSIPVLVMLVLSFVLLLPSAQGSTVNILNTYALIDNRANDIFGINGVNLNLSIDVNDSDGLGALTGAGASISVASNNGSFPLTTPSNVPLNSHIPVAGGYEFTSLRSLGVNPLSSFSGTYTFNVTDFNGATASSTSHVLQNLEVVQTPIDLAVNNNSLTPTFTFTDPDPTPDFSGLIRRYNVNVFDAGNVLVYKGSSSTIPSFTIAPGYLTPGQTYYFRAMVNDLDSTSPYALESRSSNFLTVTTTPVPEPSTMLLLGSGFIGLVGYGRRRMKK